MTDINVATTAYQTAVGLGADNKVLLALFEAGIVESGMENLNYGDRDSLGFLQQRPSMGWPNPTNVQTATVSFVTRAKSHEAMHPDWTAGQIAQAVQVSAYPAKYDQAQSQAAALLTQVSGTNPITVGTAETASLLDPVGSGAKQFISKLTEWETWAQVGMILGGGILVFVGLGLIARETKAGQAVSKAAVDVAKVAMK
jgi:hypothetical protein